VTITDRNLRDEPDLGTLKLFREGGRAAGTAVSATSDLAPVEARKSFEKARSEFVEQKPERAQRDLEKAVQIYPAFAQAWYQMGKLEQMAKPQDARTFYAKALAADPNFVLPYGQLAALAAQDEKWQEVVDNTGHALQLDPAGTAQVWYLDALGNFQLGKTDAAQASAIKALALDPQHVIPNSEQLLAVILAGKADYAGALAHLRNCLSYTPSGSNADFLKQQIAVLEQRAGTAK
jgi:tetratricopeptide (TPR) repeat protein